MPGRLPVDGKKVQEFRITLGTKERMLAEELVNGLTVKNIGEPVVNILKDVTAIGTLFAATYYLFPKLWEDPVSGEMYGFETIEQAEKDGKLDDLLEAQNILAVGLGIGLAWGTGGVSLIPTILGIVGGTAAAEIVLDPTVEAYNAAKRQSRFFRMALAMGFNPLLTKTGA
jgi:hypothetical protein